jgi:hypothetical protein
MSYTGDVGGNGSAFGPLTWNTISNPGAAAPDAVEYFQIVAGASAYLTLQVVSSVALGTDSLTFTLRKNGVDTALVAVLAAGATQVIAAGSVSVVAGDRISIKLVQSGTESTSSRCGIAVY